MHCLIATFDRLITTERWKFLEQLWQTDDMTLTKAVVTHVKHRYKHHRAC